MDEDQEIVRTHTFQEFDRVELTKSVQVDGVIYQAGTFGGVTSVSDEFINVIFDGMKVPCLVSHRFLRSVWKALKS